MTFSEFFQSNIIFFIAAFGIAGYLIYLEITGLKTRGANLSPTEFTQRINNGAVLIDLRKTDDYRSGHIAGAKHIAMDDLSNHFDSMDKNQAVALYCYTGGFSGKALAQMKKAGFTDVAHLTGGITAWKTENLPTTKS